MAMNLDTAIKFTAKLEGQGLDQLKRNLQGLSQQSNVSKRSLDQLYTATQKLGAASGNTIAGLQKTVGALKALRDNAEVGSRQFKMLTRDIEAAEARLRKFNAAAGGSGGISSGGALLAGAAGGIAANLAMSAGVSLQGIAQAGLDAENARVRLRALTNEYGEYNAALQATSRIQQTLRLSTIEAEDSFAKLYAGLRPTGVTIKEMESIFIGFNAAARASGSTAQETAAAMLQLKQSLVAGRAQGDELRSILENAPALGQAVAEEMTKLGTFGKVTRAQLKDLGSEGKISTDVLIKALERLGETELPKLKEQFDTGQQAVTDFQNAIKGLSVEISRLFGPTVLAGLRGLNALLAAGVNNLKGANDRDAAFQKARQQAAKEVQQRFPGLEGKLAIFGDSRQFFESRTQQLYQQNLQQIQNPSADNPNQKQQEAQDRAAAERQAARIAAQADADKERLKAAEEEAKIRLDTERRLADFREQSLQRAKDLERSLGDQRLELERSTAEARRRLQEQEQDFQLQRERFRLQSQGLSTEGLDVQARLNEATRRFSEQKIQIEQNATDKKIQLERTLEEYKLSVARGISEILQDAGRKLADHMQKGAKGAAATMTGAAVATGGIIARTGNTGQSTGPHLDARWADGRRISAADVDRYLAVNGRDPSSFGVTSGYGPRRMFGRNFHRGIDFGTPAGSGISLRGGASLLRDLGFTGAGGYAVEIMTPEGPMRLLHLQGGSAARPGAAVAGGTGAVNVPNLAGVEAAGRRLTAAQNANRDALGQVAAGELVGARGAELNAITNQLGQQQKSVREQREDFQRMLELQRSGLSPELAKQVVERERMAVLERDGLQRLQQSIEGDLKRTDLAEEQRAKLQEILNDSRERLANQNALVQSMTGEEQALERLKLAYEQKRQLVEGIAGAIGNGIGRGIDLLIEGTDNWGNSLRQIASGVLKDIARQIAQTMVIQPIVKGITRAFGFANGGIMTPQGPLQLRSYAAGGIANSPQLALYGEGSMPEAYVPLPDGRRIPVKMQGAGAAANVVVNVDASGSSVQGDAGRGDQLGRVIAQAVQAELIKQKRPGGLLAA